MRQQQPHVYVLRPRGVLKTTIVVFHGINSSFEDTYQTCVPQLRSAGCAIIGIDWPNFGKSVHRKEWCGTLRSYAHCVACASHLIERVLRSRFGSVPVYVCGHSLGALVAFGAVIPKHEDQVAGLIGLSLPYDVTCNATDFIRKWESVAAVVLALCSVVVPRLHVDLRTFADERARLDAWFRMRHGELPLTVRTVYEVYKASRFVRRLLKRVPRVPVLLLHGRDDETAPFHPVRKLVEAGMPVTLDFFLAGHQLTVDAAPRVVSVIVRWMNALHHQQ